MCKQLNVRLRSALLSGDSSRILIACRSGHLPVQVPIDWLPWRENGGGGESGTTRAFALMHNNLGRLLPSHSIVLPCRGPRNGGGHAATHEVFALHEQGLWLDSHPPGGSRERSVVTSYTYIMNFSDWLPCILECVPAGKPLDSLVVNFAGFYQLFLTCLSTNSVQCD